MKTVTPVRRTGQNEICLPLFLWADRRERNHLPLPARKLAARFGLTPDHARVVAMHAGFPLDGRS